MQPKPFRERAKIRLGNLRAIRVEMCSAYKAWCRGEIDDGALRAGSLALLRIASIDQGQLLEERIAALEQRLAEREAEQQPVRRNGPGFHVTRA